MGAFKNKPSESDVPDRFEIKIETYTGGPAECARRVVASVEKSLRERFRMDGCAILIRDRHHSVEIENALMQANIGYRTPVMGSYLQREEILFLRGVLAIALRNFEGITRKEVKDGIVEALDLYGNLQIPHAELQELKRGMAKHSQLHWFYEMAIKCEEGEQPSVLDSTIRYVMETSPDALADGVLREICKRMSLKKIAEKLYVRPYDAKIVMKSIDGFLSIAGVQSLKQFSESINEADRFAIKYRDKDVLTLDCVAHSKGKEFDHVILPFVEKGEYPNPMFPLQDEENLFYVGTTRAKRRLTLVTPEDGEQRSTFIKQMDIAGTRGKADVAQNRNEDAFRNGPSTRQYLRVPYFDKDRAKLLGARWDDVRKKWYVPIGMDLKPFEQWL
jgi:DNA helicase-2/ATP-dependent DNA helicase PcrA